VETFCISWVFGFLTGALLFGAAWRRSQQRLQEVEKIIGALRRDLSKVMDGEN